MKILVTLLMLLVFNLFSLDIQGGPVSGTWSLSDSPVNIYGDIEIPEFEPLTIEPGVEVVFHGHYHISVKSSIEAVGTEELPIDFYPTDNDTGWLGVRFIETNPDSDYSNFKHCSFKYGKAHVEGGGVEFQHGGAMVILNFSKVNIENCYFFSNEAFTGGAIGIRYNSNPYIRGCTFEMNSATGASSGWGGALGISTNCEPTIEGNYFIANSAVGFNYSGGGAIYFDTFSSPIIVNNLMKGNFTRVSGSPHYSNTGSAIYSHTSIPIIVNNTIIENGGYDGSSVFLHYSYVNYYNNILWGSSSICITNNTQLFVKNCNIENGVSSIQFDGGQLVTYDNNIDEDPMFTSTNDFSLTSNSPCIDSGTYQIPNYTIPSTDILGNNRFNNTIDMGAFEYTGVSIDENLSNDATLLSNYPNPFNPTTSINFNLPQEENITLSVFNSNGELVQKLINRSLFQQGSHSINFDGSNLSSGVYYYTLNTGSNITTKKMILVR